MVNKIHFARISSLIHLKLLVERWNHVGLKNKYQKSEIRSAEYRLYHPPQALPLQNGCLENLLFLFDQIHTDTLRYARGNRWFS